MEKSSLFLVKIYDWKGKYKSSLLHTQASFKKSALPSATEIFSSNLLKPDWSHRVYPVWWNLLMGTCRRIPCSWRGNTADHWLGWRNMEISLTVKRQTKSTLHGTEEWRDLYIDHNITVKDIFIKWVHF